MSLFYAKMYQHAKYKFKDTSAEHKGKKENEIHKTKMSTNESNKIARFLYDENS